MLAVSDEGGSLELSPSACSPRSRGPTLRAKPTQARRLTSKRCGTATVAPSTRSRAHSLGDEAAAVRVVTLAMVDLARSTDAESHEDTLRFLARRVYRHSQEVSVEPSGTTHLPPLMVWLGQLAQLQRACLALCVFGGHTHREAADLLGVPPSTVAELLTAGLRELGHLAAGGAATSA